MSNVNLMLHCGAREVQLSELQAQPIPFPTATHKPMHHDKFQGMVKGFLHDHDYNIQQECHALTRNGSRYFGLLEIEHNTNDYGVVVGLRNSHDKSTSGGIVIGNQVFVCDNLCFSGEVKMQRRHTINMERDLPELIEGLVLGIDKQVSIQDERIISYKDSNITHEQAEHTLCNMYRERKLGSSKLGKAIKEWDNPTHEEFAYKENVWRLYNAVTEVSKGNIFGLPRLSKSLHDHCDELSGYAVAA